MGLQRIKQSVFDSSDNFVIDGVSDIPSIPVKEREGIVIIGGKSGGLFKYNPALSQNSHNGMTIFSASGTYEVTDLGCWERIYNTTQGSLEWGGSDDTLVSNLQANLGVENLCVRITESGLGGVFQFKSAQIGNHDGVNNINGWIRKNDLNITSNLNMQEFRITNASDAINEQDYVTYRQALTLIAQGNYVGIVPQYTQEVVADGNTSVFRTAASDLIDEGETIGSYALKPECFEVCVDGQDQMPTLDGVLNDYTVDTGTGNVVFYSSPPNNSVIQIKWFQPITLEDLNNFNITATGSGVVQSMNDWVGLGAGLIEITNTGAAEGYNLQDRFNGLPVMFDTVPDLAAGFNKYAPGSLVGVKGTAAIGDGGFAFYLIRTQAEADSLGINYTSGNNILIAVDPGQGINWVAEFLIGTQAVTLYELELVMGDSPLVLTPDSNYVLSVDTTNASPGLGFTIQANANARNGQTIEIRDTKGNFGNNPVYFIPAAGQTVVNGTDLIHDYPYKTIKLVYSSILQNWSI